MTDTLPVFNNSCHQVVQLDRTPIMSRDETMMFSAFLIAFAATLGALYIGEVLGRTPCVLCWYQRIAMFPLSLLLGIAMFRGDTGVRLYVLPLALVGLLVAI